MPDCFARSPSTGSAHTALPLRVLARHDRMNRRLKRYILYANQHLRFEMQENQAQLFVSARALKANRPPLLVGD